MKSIILCLASVLIPALAARFSLPISASKNHNPRTVPTFSDFHRRSQKPLINNPNPSSNHSTTDHIMSSRASQIQKQDFDIHTTNITLGTPPQTFRAIIDLNWSELFVPSISCGSPNPRYCTAANASYDPSASSTYHENGTITTVTYNSFYNWKSLSTWAVLSSDLLTLASDLQIPNQIFHEIRYYENVYPDFGTEYFDGVLGLAVDRAQVHGHTENILPSPFRSMTDNNLLNSNMFSIIWPSENQEGSLTFGGYDEDLLEEGLIPHPLYPANTTHWQIELEGISMTGENDCGGKKLLVNKPLPHHKALLMSTYPGLILPYAVASSLIHHLPSWPSECDASWIVDCDNLSILPNITISLPGQNFTLTGEDYTHKMPAPGYCGHDIEECRVMIDVLPDQDFPQDMVVLGLPFLKNGMGVFDWDEKTISFGNLKAGSM